MITLAQHAVAAAKAELSRTEGEPCACFPVDIILHVIRT